MKKYLLIALLLLTITLVACGSDETVDTDVKNPVEDSTEVEVPEDPVKPDNTEDPVEPDAPVDDENSEVDTEEPVVDMVSWEEWATQPDSEKPCLVVWNDITRKQIIVEENGKYITEEGDRLAVPLKKGVAGAYVNSTLQELVETEYGKYYEIVLENETWNSVMYIYNEEDYMYTVKNH